MTRGRGAIFLYTGSSPRLPFLESHDLPKIFKYPVHVLKTERSVATKGYLKSFSFAHVVKTELSAGTGPRGGWA